MIVAVKAGVVPNNFVLELSGMSAECCDTNRREPRLASWSWPMASIIAEAAHTSGDIHTGLAETHPDPYGIAYLRGGTRELLKLRLFELMLMGYLVVFERRRWTGVDRWLEVAPDAPDWSKLAPPDQYWLEFLRSRRKLKEIFSLAFPPELEAACRQYRQELWQGGLLTGRVSPESVIYKRLGAVIFGIFAAIFVLGLVTRTPLLGFCAFAGLFVVGGLLHYGLAYRPSKRGREYLKDVRRQYASFVKFDSATWHATPHATKLGAVAAFGFDILFKTPVDALAQLFEGREGNGGVEYGVQSGGGCGGCGGGGCGGCGGCGG